MEHPHASSAEIFEREGVLALRGVVDVGAIDELRQRMWQLVERSFSIRESDPGTWYGNQEPIDGEYQGYRLSGMNHIMEQLNADQLFQPVRTAIEAEVATVFGADRWEPSTSGTRYSPFRVHKASGTCPTTAGTATNQSS